jgi:hypothetical protein
MTEEHSPLVPSRNVLQRFLQTLRRYEAEARKCHEFENARVAGQQVNLAESFRAGDAVSRLWNEIYRTITSLDFSSPHGWPEALTGVLSRHGLLASCPYTFWHPSFRQNDPNRLDARGMSKKDAAKYVLDCLGSAIKVVEGALASTIANGESLSHPRWDRDSRTLYFGTEAVLQLTSRAKNQIQIFEAFEKARWPASVANPLDQFRMAQTIKDLNRRLREQSPNCPFEFHMVNLKLGWKMKHSNSTNSPELHR